MNTSGKNIIIRRPSFNVFHRHNRIISLALLRQFSTSLRRSDATTADMKDSTIDSIESKTFSKKRPLTYQERKLIESMIRVDHAGELGANYIYKGQMAILGKDKKVGHVIQEMWDQEKVHLRTFDEIIPRYRVRPTLLRPLWETAGFVLGAGTALMGKEAAMACTEAVETVIGEHYNDQLRELIKIDNEETTELREVIKKFRDDELHHLETSVDYDAQKAPLYGPLSAIIHAGCKAAIWVTTRL